MHDFRPICLLSGVYKIIGKLLASRLKEVMVSLVSNFQCGGLHDKQIHEGILVVNEHLDSRLKPKTSGLAYKIDFSKAFDSFSWDFLDKLLSKFGSV